MFTKKDTKMNVCKSPKAATTEGTINCYMEADACDELQIITFGPIPLARHRYSPIFSANHYKMYMKRGDKCIE